MHRLESNGCAVAAALSGAWRSSPPKLDGPGVDFAAIAPLLVESGAGALGWWRIRHSAGAALPSVLHRLRATYLRYAIQAAEYEREIVDVFNALRSSGVEPILLKGWAIGRAYPESGLRPSGDIDLYVSPDQYARARAVLGGRQSCYSVDLDHDTITRFSELTFEDLYLRSQLVNFDDTEIRVLGAEVIFASFACTCSNTAPGAHFGCVMLLPLSSRDRRASTGIVAWERTKDTPIGFSARWHSRVGFLAARRETRPRTAASRLCQNGSLRAF